MVSMVKQGFMLEKVFKEVLEQAFSKVITAKGQILDLAAGRA